MPKKIRQFCDACKQVTTQIKERSGDPWKCLCCESAKIRGQSATAEIQQKNKTKPRFNVSF